MLGVVPVLLLCWGVVDMGMVCCRGYAAAVGTRAALLTMTATPYAATVPRREVVRLEFRVHD